MVSGLIVFDPTVAFNKLLLSFHKMCVQLIIAEKLSNCAAFRRTKNLEDRKPYPCI